MQQCRNHRNQPWRLLAKGLLILLLALSGIHLMGTGSPIPLWYFERLENSRAVQAISEGHLTLADQTELALPKIQRIPAKHPLFQAALVHGVEVDSAGELIGLVPVDRACGNDPILYRRLRINLSHLAGALDPEGIEVSAVTPDAIEFLKEYTIQYGHRRSSHERGHLTFYDLMNVAHVKRQFEDPIDFSQAYRVEGNPQESP
ncbi:Hypothetical protein PBC10988_26380 [Planctomycetales bacterium 10988]|nr:Hypothetical protein PBC10988_26380 [Planctomycetales bacterium 10988]